MALKKLLLFSIIMMVVSLPSNADRLSIYVLRSAFIYNFITFTQWPETHVDINICVYGNQVYQQLLTKIIEKKPPVSRSMSVVDAASVVNYSDCSVLIISESGQIDAKKIGVNLDHSNTLVITDNESGYDVSMIYLSQEDNRVSFSINMENLNDSNVKISSKLLRLSQGYK